MAKRINYSLLIYRAHNLLKDVAEAYKYYIIKICSYTFLYYRRSIVKYFCQVSANLLRLDYSKNHRCILTIAIFYINYNFSITNIYSLLISFLIYRNINYSLFSNPAFKSIKELKIKYIKFKFIIFILLFV
jgi:hypothetical protein